MITKFDSLYAGHVDMDNVGYGGTAVNDRSFSDEYLATAFDKAQAIAPDHGPPGLRHHVMAEHHFQPEGYECIPNLLMLNVHLAHLTKSLKFGCGFNITPMWNPLRLAEDFATADILTNGRVIFGVGRGYHTREVETFGAPLLDQPANRDLFEEQVEIILKSFNERSFSHQGKNYTIPPRVPYRGYELEEITLVPRPRYLPVETWQPIQSATPRALEFMARHGIKGMIGGGVSEGGAIYDVIAAYRDALVRAGREDAQLGEDLAIGFHFFLADTQEAGHPGGCPATTRKISRCSARCAWFDPFPTSRLMLCRDPQRAPTAGLPTIERAVERQGFLCGPPELIVEQLKKLEEQYPGLDRVGMSHPVGTPEKGHPGTA